MAAASSYDAAYAAPGFEGSFMQSPEDGSSTRSQSQQSVLSGMINMAGIVVKAGQSFVAHPRADLLEYPAETAPPLLRFLCFLGGLMMTFTNTLAVMNVFTLLTAPPVYMLQAYQLLFGLIIMTLEARDWDCFDGFKPALHEWFRFLTVPAGRGAFYLFVGSLGISLWMRSFASFTGGLYMTAMGVSSLLVHLRSAALPPYGPVDEQFAGEGCYDDAEAAYGPQ